MSSSKRTNSSGDGVHDAINQLLLQSYTPAALLLNGDGDIVHINGRTGKYLEPAAGKANWNFHSMARDELREPLLRAINKANGQEEPIHINGLRVSLSNGTQFLDATVRNLKHPEVLKGMSLIMFSDTAMSDGGDRRRSTTPELDSSLEAELQRYRDEIKALREEAIESREELQSSNEKLQSMNEELQSANEELTTSKEEMQSMNEELQTINSELEAKLEALSQAESDMQNVLNSTEIAILFLDQDLNIRRYTDRAAKLVNLRESDVGRPLSDLTTTLQYPSLHDDAQETLRTLAFSEKQIPADDGRWHAVRIMPYRRVDNVIDGVVITLVDITESKKLESALREESTL